MNEQIKRDIEKIREAQAAYKQLIKDIGLSGLKELANDTLQKTGATRLQWSQYTPYFNDGDPCEFGVNDASLEINGDWEDGWDLYDWDHQTRQRTYKSEQAHITYDALSEFNSTIGSLSEILEEVFGDHKKVTFDGSGFDVEDYDHD